MGPAATPLLPRYYSLGENTKALIFQLVVIHNAFCVLPSLAAACGRLVFSCILGQWLARGVAMCTNWIASAIAYTARLKSGKRKQFKII